MSQRLRLCGREICQTEVMLLLNWSQAFEIQSNFNLKFSHICGLYQLYMERTKKKQEWTPEEMELLTQLYPQFSSKKWKIISGEFRLRGYVRNEIECREKWINFLDPSVRKSQWEESELRRLYDLHEEVGTRWCLIQKEINRTQNKIKNRFYGTIRNLIRFVLAYFDSNRTCYNAEISKLSPKFLNDLYASQTTFAFMNGEPRRAIYDMKFVVDKKLMAETIREHRSLYSRMHQIIFEAFETFQTALSAPSSQTSPQPEMVEPQPELAVQIKREESAEDVQVKLEELGVPAEGVPAEGVQVEQACNWSDYHLQAQGLFQMVPRLQFHPMPQGLFYWYG